LLKTDKFIYLRNEKVSMIFSLLAAFSLSFATPHAVTNDPQSGGRFGDKLLTYLRAKWISYHYDIPFYYQPFEYSKRLLLHERERFLVKRDLYLEFALSGKDIDLNAPNPSLFVCSFFPYDLWEIQKYGYKSFEVDWKDPKFRKMVKRLIAPKKKLKLEVPPGETINVAVHIREGGTVDDDETKARLPLKLPPMHFYLDGLEFVLSKYPDNPVTCHVFTDAVDPSLLIQKLKAAFPQKVHFTYRAVNRCGKNVLEDFFSFFHFDCLIRPQSNFSIIPSLLHDFAIVYSPVKFEIKDKKAEITEVQIEFNQDRYDFSILRTQMKRRALDQTNYFYDPYMRRML
jgi:hypothetical protein